MNLLRERLGRLTTMADAGREGTLHVEAKGKTEEVPLPAPFFRALERALTTVAEGRAVQITATDDELTTGEAARLLAVSRPHLVKLLEEGKIPFRKVGTHRRVRRRDLLAYRQQMQHEAEEAYEELARQAQELDMGYGDASTG